MTRHPETRAIHEGQSIDETKSRAVPVHRTTAYLFDSAEHAANLFALKEMGNIYTRLMNPTQDVLEKRMAALEGGIGALALSSGTAAIFYSVINLCKAGDEIVSSRFLYGGTHTMFAEILKDHGITVRFADPRTPASFADEIRPNTRALFTEAIGNPTLDVADLEGLSKLARENGIPLIVDSTFTPPPLLKPMDHGATITVHSLSKWIGGHGTGIGGIVVDSGDFPWNGGRHPLYTEPDASYHGVRWGEDLGDLQKLAYILRMRLVPLRNLGACISPDNAWIFLQGMETLFLRMTRHCENALKIAKYLEGHPEVAWIRYPGLPEDPSHELACRILENGFGGMVVFGIRGGRERGKTVIDRLSLFSHLANVGDAKSLAVHPASTTHQQLSADELAAAGVGEDLIRLSIGLEHPGDLIADLDQALAQE